MSTWQEERAQQVVCEIVGSLIVIICILNFFPFLIGSVEAVQEMPKPPMRRIEYIIPGYWVGRWFFAPLHKN